ncbi:MAG: 50S ribosomal protein L10 [Chloroflexi bacterium]|nr:50S ribosomal protein L10 [Chloroflexota bacterium]
MPTQQKRDRVQDIKGRLERSSIAMTTKYSGISVNQMVELRRAMKAGGVDFTIVKNTLLHLAAEEAQIPQLKEIVEGPTAIALGYEDPAEAAKTVADYIRTGGSTLAIMGAVMGGGAVMSSAEVTKLASLPPKAVLLAMLLGQMQSPISRLLSVLNGPLQSLDNVLQARIRQLEAEAPAPAPEPEPAPGPEASAESQDPGAAEESPPAEAGGDEEPAAEAASESPADEAPADDEPAAEAEDASADEAPADEESAAEATEAEPDPEPAEEESAEEPEAKPEPEPEAETAGEEEAE